MPAPDDKQLIPAATDEVAVVPEPAFDIVLTTPQRRRLHQFFTLAGATLGSFLAVIGVAGGHTFLGPFFGLTLVGCGFNLGLGVLTYVPPMLGVYRREYDRTLRTTSSIRMQLSATSLDASFEQNLEAIEDRALILCHEASRLTLAVQETLQHAEKRGRFSWLNKALGSGKALFDHVTGQAALDAQNVARQSYRVAVTREIDQAMVQANRAHGPQKRDLEARARELRQERDLFDERVARIEKIDGELDSLWRALDRLHEKSQQTRAAHQRMIADDSRSMIDQMHTDLDDVKHALTEVSKLGGRSS